MIYNNTLLVAELRAMFEIDLLATFGMDIHITDVTSHDLRALIYGDGQQHSDLHCLDDCCIGVVHT